jgi:hypothetical protein
LDTDLLKLYNSYTDKITVAFKSNIYQTEDGSTRVNAQRTKEREKYLFHGFKEDGSDDIILIECPLDVLAIEFEENSTTKEGKFISTRENRNEWIDKAFDNATKLNIASCIVDHGGTSRYLYAFGLKNLPEGKELEAKKAIAKKLVPDEAWVFIDQTNLGKTLIPIIGRPHWKPKYKGALHTILRGTHPAQHNNDISELIKNIKFEEKKERSVDKKAKFVKEHIKLIDLMTEKGYDISKNPTMCMLGHDSEGKKCFSFTPGGGKDGEDVWNCFHCQAAGDVIDFVMFHEPLEYIEARNLLYNKARSIHTYEIRDYQMLEINIGFLFQKKFTTKKGGEYYREIALFKKIERQCTTRLDAINKSSQTELQTQINTIKNVEITAFDDKDLVTALNIGKRGNYNELCSDDEQAFVDIIELLPIKNIKATNVLGFYSGKYHDHPEYSSYNTVFKQVGPNQLTERPLITPSKNYMDFISLNPDEKIVKKLIETLNNDFPRNPQEAMFHKIILSFAVASSFKITLIENGIRIHPYLIVLGGKQMGKTTACRILVTKLFKSSDLSMDHFEGVKGARLKGINNDVFPVTVDELSNFTKWESNFKESMSRGYLEIVRGTKEGGSTVMHKYFNLIIPTNDFRTSDVAFRDRLIMFDYSHTNIHSNVPVLLFLEENIHHLGKYMYSDYHNIDTTKLILDSKSEQTAVAGRKVDKDAYIMFGQKILDRYGILTKYRIDPSMFSDDQRERETTTVTDILEIINDRLNIIYDNRSGGSSRLITPKMVLEKEDNRSTDTPNINFDENVNTFFSSKGIYFTQSFKNIVIGTEILPYINKELQRKGHKKTYSKMKMLAEDLNMGENYKAWGIRKFSNGALSATTIRGLKIENEQ